MALVFDFQNSIIEVPAPTISISIQTLINEIRDQEDDFEPAMAYAKIADAVWDEIISALARVLETISCLTKTESFGVYSPNNIPCNLSGMLSYLTEIMIYQ